MDCPERERLAVAVAEAITAHVKVRNAPRPLDADELAAAHRREDEAWERRVEADNALSAHIRVHHCLL